MVGLMMDVPSVPLNLGMRVTHWFVPIVRRSQKLLNQSKGEMQLYIITNSPNIFVPHVFAALTSHTYLAMISLSECRLKIHYTIGDETGTASVVFWDKLASQLLDKSAAELKQILMTV